MQVVDQLVCPMKQDFLERQEACIGQPQLEEELLRLIASRQVSEQSLERRCSLRYPFPEPLQLFPVLDGSDVPNNGCITVVGKQLSPQGIGFYHKEPLPARRAVVVLTRPDGRKLELLVALLWCRYLKGGWYESGGKFLRLLRVL